MLELCLLAEAAATQPVELITSGAFFTTENMIALLALATLEIVLGIDNVVFIAIVAGKLPAHQQVKTRNIGLLLAAVVRILLLLVVAQIMQLTETLFEVLGQGISGKDMILLGGGLFLIWKAVHEIHDKLETPKDEQGGPGVATTFGAVLVQILLLDLVFSLDSIITAVGMAKNLYVMIVAIVIAVAVMIGFAGPVSRFVEQHPTMRMLALAFLVLIGVLLVAEGLHQHVEKGYIYFAMAFSFIVEMLNIRARKARRPVQLHARQLERAGVGKPDQPI